MRSSRRWWWYWGLALWLFCPHGAWAQVFVFPRAAGKTDVRHFRFDWRHVDVHVNGGDKGGVRLFFYEREGDVAERAAASIEASFKELTKAFRYEPTRTFPYYLYSSYPEFLETNLFPLQEGVLGVTSPIDLKLALPYLGDHQLFQEISTHELVHQFTIQKVATLSEKAGISTVLELFPLWFIEGLAEFYAKDGFDPEAQLLVRDLVLNPDPANQFVLGSFFDEAPMNFLWIYKMGQARCAFLAETYGADILQRALEEAPRAISVPMANRLRSFPELLERLSGDRADVISQKFDTWLKRHASQSFLNGSQDLSTFRSIPGLPRNVDALSVSPDGNAVLVRTLDVYTGQSRLLLLDPRVPSRHITLVADGKPGAESLHPVFGRNFSVGRKAVAYVAQAGGRDVIHLRRFEHHASPVPAAKSVPARSRWEVDMDLEDRAAFSLDTYGMIAVPSIALSPDETRIAFIGLNEAGVRDVYVLSPGTDGNARLTQLTRDSFAEREVVWGPEGIVYTSDNTSHRKYNVFRIREDAPEQVERLTTEPRDQRSLTVLSDGRVMFVTDEDGHANLFEVTAEGIARRTDVSSGLFDANPGPEGSVFALLLHQGQRRLVHIPDSALIPPEVTAQPEGLPAEPLPRRPLEDSTPYESLAVRNWELGPTIALLGGGAGGIAGTASSSAMDTLRNHALILQLSLYGSFALLDGHLIYLNQEQRITWGAGLFQQLRFRFDRSIPDLESTFYSGERFTGAMLIARYPFSSFFYAEGDLAVGGAAAFLLPVDRVFLSSPEINGHGDFSSTWDAANEGFWFQSEATLRLGYDTLRYHALAGPVSGGSGLFEGTVGFRPGSRDTYGNFRLDGAKLFPFFGTSRLVLRGSVGTTFGGRLARQFFLSSPDTLRGVRFADPTWLLGRHFIQATTEIQVPLDVLVRVLFLSRIAAVVGLDFGGVSDQLSTLLTRRVLDVALGVNLSLGPILFRVHFARPLDIGSPAGLPAPSGEWVPNVSLRILGLEGFFSSLSH